MERLSYPELYLWDTPMKGLRDPQGRELVSPPTLREMRIDSAVNTFDIDAHILSEDGMLQARQWKNVILYSDEMDPAVLDYWRSLGWEKRLYCADQLEEKWSCLYPLSASSPESADRLYPLYFVLHGGTTPPFEMEGNGFCESTAADEPIIIIPQNFSIEGVLRLYRYALENFPVDRSRVYASSFCGGNRSTQVALRYPEIFAAIAPCGNPLRENYKPVMWYPDYERVRRLGLPCCHIDGLDDITQLLPLWHSGDPALSESPRHPGRTYDMPLAKREYKVSCLRDYLFTFGCRDVTPDEVFACEFSENPVLRATGAPADQTEIISVYGKKHFVARFRNQFDRYWLEIVAIESLGHFPDASLGKAAWDFLRRFRRDMATGAVIDMSASSQVSPPPGPFTPDRWMNDITNREKGYNTAWDGTPV